MKQCSKCHVDKPLSDFYYRKDRGRYCYTSYCRKCNCKATTKNRENNKDRYREYSRKEYYADIDNKRQKWREYYKRHPEYMKMRSSISSRKYKAHVRKATPDWSDISLVDRVYFECYEMNKSAGFTKYHVDHIIPLRGDNVSGLHVPENLRIIEAKENLSKSNKFES